MLGCAVFHLEETCHIVVLFDFLLVGRRRRILVALLIALGVETRRTLAPEYRIVLLVCTVAVLLIRGAGAVLDHPVVRLVTTGAWELVLLLEGNDIVGHEASPALGQTRLVVLVNHACRDVVVG